MTDAARKHVLWFVIGVAVGVWSSLGVVKITTSAYQAGIHADLRPGAPR